MKKLLLLLALSGCVAAGHAQEILLGTDFKMYFDNKEFGSNEFAVPGLDIESGTDFAARLTPRVGIRWDEKNTLVIAADMIKNFGTKESAYLSEIKPVFYYQFQTPKVTAAAGIFTRDMMHDDDYSTAFFSESERFFHNRMNGVLAQYNGKRNSYVEFVCDWEGMYSTLSREKFRILLAGRHYLDTFYYGFNYSMFHYAGQQGAPIENVVDLQLLNPCVRVRFNAFFDFDIKLGALLTAQRDRSFGHSWGKPCMGEFAFRISRWGLSLDERLYVGQGQGYQIVQSLFSLADGGLVGVGIGNGMANNIPVVESDFIFSAIGEEMGLLGGGAVLILFMLFAVRGLTTAARAKSDLAAFSATGLTAAISFQAFLIVGGVTRLIPLTGVTLPFMSQGGSSLLASFIIVALLLRAGDEATGREAELTGTGTMAAITDDQVASAAAPTGTRFATSSSYGSGSHSVGSRMRRRLLDTPESGVLGRVALANRLTRAVLAFTALFAILIGNLTYVQVIKAKDYQDMPTNNHTIARSKYIQRGSIITSDGVTLAESLQQEDGTYVRSYPNDNLAAHVVGYVSQQYGTTAIESVMNDTLTGSKDYSSWNNAIASLAGQTQPGNTAKLTIDSRIQTAAEQALKGFKGAVVVIDPRTGAVLACASSPTYDNTNIDALLQTGGGEDGSMYNRAMDALYTPGSTFKVVTLSAALETGTASLTSTYQAPGSMDIGNAPVTNSANESYGTISLQQAFAVSSNVVFGQVANEIGASSLVQFANAFGYGQKLGQDLTSAASIMADPSLMTEWETAWAGAGQPVGMDHTPGPQTTVMQNCVIAAAIANSGVVMDPFFVSQILAPDGTVVKTTQSRSLGQAVSSATADQVKQAMLAVVQSGTGTDAQIPGVKVAGKTGSAEVGGANVNSMFVGFAPYDSPTVAISVALEDYDKHDVEAAKIAGIVLTAALAAQGA